MTTLGQVIHPNMISVINKLASVGMSVPERTAYHAFVNFARPAQQNWQQLTADFREKIDAKDPETIKDLDKEWTKEVDAPKLPASLLSKPVELSPNEDLALQDVCG